MRPIDWTVACYQERRGLPYNRKGGHYVARLIYGHKGPNGWVPFWLYGAELPLDPYGDVDMPGLGYAMSLNQAKEACEAHHLAHWRS